ncbi:MAG: YitT family protein [Ruthenibacterium sp.]
MKKQAVETVLLNVSGILLNTIGVLCFAVPHKIAPGGVSGIAILVNYVTGFPLGLFGILFNLPLLMFIVWKKLFPMKFVLRTGACILLISLSMDILKPILPVYQGNPLLAAMFAGAFMGVGLGLVYLSNSDTGGITLLGQMIRCANAALPIGALISGINFLVVLSSGPVYKNIESILYAIVTVYISGLFMDKLVDTVRSKNMFIVMSQCTDKVRCALVESHTSITILKGEGGYTSETQRVILGAAGKSECSAIQKQIEQVDPDALFIVADARKVSGKNFGHII